MISDILASKVDITKSGNNIKINCPFHNEDTPSCFVDKDSGKFYCFGCHKGGGFKTLLKQLNVEIDIDIKPTRKVIVAKPEIVLDEGILRNYMYKPKLDKFNVDLLLKHKIGYDVKRSRNIFPIRNWKGELVGVSGGTTIGATPKYKVYRGGYWADKWYMSDYGEWFDELYPNYGTLSKSKYIWNYDKVFGNLLYSKKKENVFIVEGFKAALWLIQHGFENTVALMGSAVYDDQVALLSRLDARFFVFLDNDAAGKKGTEEIKEKMREFDLNFVKYIKNYRQPDDFCYDDLVNITQQSCLDRQEKR